MHISSLVSCLFHCVIPDNKLVFFMSFYGLYNDNPKYISECLHLKNPDITIAWCIDEKRCNVNEIPDYVRVIKSGSIKKLFYQNRARVLVDNMAGWYSMAVSQKEYRLCKLLKNKRVFNLSTWHGTPKKKIGVDAYNNDIKHDTFFTTADVILDNSSYVKNIFSRCFQNQMPVRISGTPRNDLLVNANRETISSLKKKFNIDTEKKVVIYAPTYRSKESGYTYSERFDFMYGLDVDAIIAKLLEIFGGDWIFIFRGHQFDQSREDFVNFTKTLNTKIINGNLYDDMAEYLAVSDVLITDYSGSMFDYVITGRPCFLYTPDKEIYENSQRGVYEVELPFKYNLTNEELCNSIQEFNGKEYMNCIKKFIKKQGMYEDGRAAERAVDIICDVLRK